MKWLYALAVVALAGCASYQGGSLPSKDVFSHATRCEDKGVHCAVKFFDPAETKKVFQLNLQEKGIEPVYVVIDNRSADTIQFSKSMVNKTIIPPDQVAQKCGFSTVGRATSYGVGAIFLWPLAVPAIVDGVGSSQANQKMKDDYGYKEIKDERIQPNGLLSGVLFVDRMKPGEDISIRLQKINTNEIILFSFKKP